MKTASSSFIEVLESRIAPAGVVTADINLGVLTLSGDGVDNVVQLSVLAPGVFRLAGTGTNVAYEGGAPAASVDFSDVFTSVVINGNAGNDQFTLNGLLLAKTLTFNGGDGNDTIFFTNTQVRGATNLFGDATLAGDDSFAFSGVSNRFALLHIEGGAGADTVTLGGNSLQTAKLEILGGAGADVINGSSTLFSAASLLLDGGTEPTTMGLAGFGNILIPGAVKLVQGEHTGTAALNFGAPNTEIGSLVLDLKGTTNNAVVGVNNGVILVKGAITVTGGAGSDNFGFNGLSVATGAVKFTAGDGANTFTTNPNLQNLQMASATYTGGINADTISFLGGDLRTKAAFNVDLGGGAGKNTVNLTARSFVAASAKVIGGAAVDDVNFEPSVFLSVKGGITATLGAGNDIFDLSSSRLDAGAITVTMASATTDLVNLSLSANTTNLGAIKITTGAGASNTAIGLGAGTIKAFTYTGGAGSDVIGITANALRGAAFLLNLGDGGNDFALNGTDNEIASLAVNTGAGTDKVTLTGLLSIKGLTNLMLGAGNSNVTLGGATNSLGLVLQGGLKLVTTGTGANTDTFVGRNFSAGKATNLTFGDGASSVTIDNFNTIAAFNLLTGGGSDTVAIERDPTFVGISRILNKITIDLGADSDSLAIGRNSVNESVQALAATIKGGAGTDTLVNNIEDDNDITLVLKSEFE